MKIILLKSFIAHKLLLRFQIKLKLWHEQQRNKNFQSIHKRENNNKSELFDQINGPILCFINEMDEKDAMVEGKSCD